jgi:hypothetical protein
MPSKDQQIKDIIAALEFATPEGGKWHLSDENYGYTYLFADAINQSQAYTACVNREQIGTVTYQNANGIGLPFDCSAYVRYLHNKGYKI